MAHLLLPAYASHGAGNGVTPCSHLPGEGMGRTWRCLGQTVSYSIPNFKNKRVARLYVMCMRGYRRGILVRDVSVST